jgi:hypothetical protein
MFINKFYSIKPGDFILLRNCRAHPGSTMGADLLLKMPGLHGSNNTYNRTIAILGSYCDIDSNPAEFSCQMCKEAEPIIKNIYQRGKEINIEFISPSDFTSS